MQQAPTPQDRTQWNLTPWASMQRDPMRRTQGRSETMTAAALAHHAQEALFLTIALSLPVLAVAAIVGLVVAAFQAASQIQDPTLAHLPRLLAVIAALALLGPWIGREVAAFAEQAFVANVPR